MKKEFFTFCSIGIINTFIDFSIFNLLLNFFGISNWIILFNIISYSIAIVNSFILNSKITFNKKIKINNFGKFYIILIFGLGLNTSIVYLLYLIDNSQLSLNIFKLIASLIVAFVNYTLCKKFIFGEINAT